MRRMGRIWCMCRRWIFDEGKFIGDVDRVFTKLGRCVVAVSEGVRYKAEDKKSLLAEKIMEGGEVDAHGNRQLSGSGALADYLTNLIKRSWGRLGRRSSASAVRGIRLGICSGRFRRLFRRRMLMRRGSVGGGRWSMR